MKKSKMKEVSGLWPHSYFVREIDNGLGRKLCEPFTCIVLFGFSGRGTENSKSLSLKISSWQLLWGL